MLDERKAEILRAVVEEYIDTAQPVGSSRLVQTGGLQVSPATVRNELSVLEREGYLIQPHTSAGRVPTEKGYRFFVDQLTPKGTLQPVQRQAVLDFFSRTHGELEQMLHATSRLLSGLTDYAAVVISPPHEAATVRAIQLVGLAPRFVLVVAVLSNGVVEKRSLELTGDAEEHSLNAASNHLAAHLVGRPLGAAGKLPSCGDPDLDAIVETALTALHHGHDDEPDHVFVGGASRMVAAFDAVDTVRQVLSILEQQYVVVTLLKDVLDRGLSVAIGSEVGHESLAECSVVVAPYEVEGEAAGTIGVVGPTRMKYPQALAAVALVSQRLGRRLSES
ncbi:MAG: heat-inducible transcriptional repressor HrcA [Actinobacteria bacterium]|nr:heat-inducible transcriptional repressor HrcA [Actinomycetota bacterium]MBW3649344.1 heat-inducible transcriptional repressor HrcA [Actinomycetota bacterium]